MVKDFNGERWRVITPIMLASLSVLSGINVWVLNDIKDSVKENHSEINEQDDRLGNLEKWKSSLNGHVLTYREGIEIKEDIIDYMESHYPPKDLLEDVKDVISRVKELEDKRR